MIVITDENGQTSDGQLWEINQTVVGNNLLAYDCSCKLALFFSRCKNPRVFETDGTPHKKNHILAYYAKLSLKHEIIPIRPTIEQRIRFAIKIAWPTAWGAWKRWAECWVCNADRTQHAALDAEEVANTLPQLLIAKAVQRIDTPSVNYFLIVKPVELLLAEFETQPPTLIPASMQASVLWASSPKIKLEHDATWAMSDAMLDQP